MEENDSFASATVVQLMPNCPFVSVDTLLDCVKTQQEIANQSLISCINVDAINWYAFTLDNNQPNWIANNVDLNSRTQDNYPIYVPSGSVWIANGNYLLTHKSFYGPTYKFHVIPFLDGYDIDTLDQLELARIIDSGMKSR